MGLDFVRDSNMGLHMGSPTGHEGLESCEEVNSGVMEPEVWRP